MSDRYFEKFPRIVYANTNCVDISRRAQLSTNTFSDLSLFYKYQLQSGLREDFLANDYYQDPYRSWIIYIGNQIVDPYYGWYLQQEQLDDFVVSTFGDIQTAIDKIKFYRLNWPTDSENISVDRFDNSLPGQLRKYYDPVFGMNDQIISYKRAKDDFTVVTNILDSLALTSITGVFERGEIVDVSSGGHVIGTAEVVKYDATNSALYVNNIRGFMVGPVEGRASGATATSSTATVVYRNIPIDEEVFWDPISWYDWYNEENEKNKNIKLLRVSMADGVSQALSDTLR